MTLHLVFSSPFNSNALKECLACVAPTDGILFLEDGVYANQHSQDLTSQNELYMLHEDCIARGLEASASFQTINYDDFVSLTLKYSKTVSWR